jgi:hypothetical protein
VPSAVRIPLAKPMPWWAPERLSNPAWAGIGVRACGTAQITKETRMAKKRAKKPKGWKAFDTLVRKLLRIPKGEVDQQVAKSKADRLRRRRRKQK